MFVFILIPILPIMFRIFHDTDIQKCISNPLHGDRDVVDGMQDNLGIQVFD